MRPLVIFGVGGFGREVHTLVEDLNAQAPTHEVLGFLDGNRSTHRSTVHGLPVLGDADWLAGRPEVAVVVGIGSPSAKRRVAEGLRAAGGSFATLVHPRATVGRRVVLGDGVVVCAGCVLTTEITVGPLATINLNCTVGHDSTIGAFATLSPGVHLSGNLTVEEGADVGTGTTTVQGIRIGAWSVVGAGAAVTADVPPDATAVGVPARVVKQREPGWQV